MRIATIEEFLSVDEITEIEERQSIHSDFPHVVLVEGDFPEFDVAVRWCWQTFGPLNGECWSNSEYPACPIVLVTEHEKDRIAHGKEYKIKAYDQVERHKHQGTWAIHWLGKTDYDHGFGEFCFANEEQLRSFSEQVPKINWGENYPWLKE